MTLSAIDLARSPGTGKLRAVPRMPFAIDPARPQKSRWLTVFISMVCKGMLPQHGEKVRNARYKGQGPKKVTQAQLTPGLGVASRSTVTKRIDEAASGDCPLIRIHSGAFGEANSYEFLLPPRTHEYFVLRGGRRVKLAGTKRDARFGSRENAVRFAEANGLDAGNVKETELDPGCYYYSEASDLASLKPPKSANAGDNAEAPLASMFHPDLMEGSRGFAYVPTFLWDASLGISDDARLVATWYVMCGIREARGKDGKPQNWIRVNQRTTCARLGICRDTLRKAHRELRAIGLVNAVGDVNPVDGRTIVDKIFWMPGRVLSHTGQEFWVVREVRRADGTIEDVLAGIHEKERTAVKMLERIKEKGWKHWDEFKIRTVVLDPVKAERYRLHQAAQAQHEYRKALRRRLRMIREHMEALVAEGRMTVEACQRLEQKHADDRLNVVLSRSKAMLAARKALGASVSPQKTPWARLAACNEAWRAHMVKVLAERGQASRLDGAGVIPLEDNIRIPALWGLLEGALQDAGCDPSMIAALIPKPDL